MYVKQADIFCATLARLIFVWVVVVSERWDIFMYHSTHLLITSPIKLIFKGKKYIMRALVTTQAGKQNATRRKKFRFF